MFIKDLQSCYKATKLIIQELTNANKTDSPAYHNAAKMMNALKELKDFIINGNWTRDESRKKFVAWIKSCFDYKLTAERFNTSRESLDVFISRQDKRLSGLMGEALALLSQGRVDEGFLDCTSLTSITLPARVTEIDDRAFLGCTSLTSITLPDNVTEIPLMAFADCTSLTSINIPDTVTKINASAFSNCTSLTSVTIPDSVTLICDEAFSGCTSLTSVTIPDIVQIVHTPFDGCTNLKKATYRGKTYSYENIDDLYDAINDR